MPSSHASEGTEQRTNAQEGHEQHEQNGPDAAALTAELARAEERHKRALADLDNYRKRSAREVERRGVELRESLVRDWLEVVDSVERSLRIEPTNPLYEGMRAVLEVARSGFAIGDRVLRPAQVVVSRRRQAEPSET